MCPRFSKRGSALTKAGKKRYKVSQEKAQGQPRKGTRAAKKRHKGRLINRGCSKRLFGFFSDSGAFLGRKAQNSLTNVLLVNKHL
jgi:hypothetical protein